MNKAMIRLQVFFEIATSIGNSLDMSRMLQSGLSTYLGKLNCAAGAVFEARKDDKDRYTNHLLFSIPRRIHMSPVFSAAVNKIPPHFNEDDHIAFTEKLPIVLAEKDKYFSHISNLPGFGFLVLLKAGIPLEDEVLLSLRPVNRKLADSCRACLRNEKINQLVNRLKAEIDERAKIEAALRESHDRFLTVMDSIDAAVYAADVESYEIQYMNRKMIDSFGGNFEGKLCYQVFKERATPCEDCINPLFLDAKGESTTDVHIREDRNPVTGRWYIYYDRAIKWVNGRWTRLQVATDITQVKKLQEKQSRAEARLRQVQKMESIGNLAGGIAHDFNNILASILGFTEVALLDVEKGTPLEDNLQEIYAAGRRAKDLVQHILAFARQSDMEIKPVPLGVIAKEALKFIRSSIPTTIQIQHDISSKAIIMGNATQSHQVLMNLFTNAAHAMEGNGGILKVSLKDIATGGDDKLKRLGLRNGNYVRIEVADSGTGIPPDIVDSIFEPYFTTKGPGTGTGLGLAMVQGIVESYAGKITVDSTPGRGSTFTIYLPAAQQSESHRQYDPEALSSGSERILVVDDEASVAKMSGMVLESLGYAVRTRTSSLDALELFRSKPTEFDLVITDMTMPGLTGDKLAVELMKIRPDIPIILCTGYSKQISEESAARIGIKAFAYKPIVTADLSKTIRKVLDEAKG